MFSVRKGNLRDKFITLVASMDSKIDEKIDRAKSELSESTGESVDSLQEQIQANLESIQQIQQTLETLETSADHSQDIQNLNAQVSGISDTLVNSTIRVLNDIQLGQLELKANDKIIYLKINDLTIYSRELVENEPVDTPIGRLASIEPSL